MQNLGFPKCGNTSQKQWKTNAKFAKFHEMGGDHLEFVGKPMRNGRCFGTSKKQVNPLQNLGFPKCENTSQKHWKTNAKLVKFHENGRKSLAIHCENQCEMIGVLGLRKSK